MSDKIPASIRNVWEILLSTGPTYLVGGAVRDLLRCQVPHDWDLATQVHPDVAQDLAKRHGYRVIATGERFGTVTWLTDAGPVEVTTFRQDGRYVDGRRPEAVQFSDTIEEDLGRRDFTMNAIAMTPEGSLIDPYDGERALQEGRIDTVGTAGERFSEDPLRMLRAVRFAGLDVHGTHFVLSTPVREAIRLLKPSILQVSAERQQAELWKILGQPHFAYALSELHHTGLLGVLWPEWKATEGFPQQNPHHAYTVDQHLLATASQGRDPLMRLVGLLHDIAKPNCFWQDPEGVGHFYDHDHAGALYARRMLRSMAFDSKTTDRVCVLIDQHMFPWQAASDKAIRRMIRVYGVNTIRDLVELRRMDEIGAGVSDIGESIGERVERLISEVPPESRKLALNGHDVMALSGVGEGHQIGVWLRELQDWVDDDPSRNTKPCLTEKLRVMTSSH